MDTIFIAVKEEEEFEVVSSVNLDIEVDTLSVSVYEEDNFGGTTETYSEHPVISVPLFGGFAMAKVVVLPDHEIASLILESMTIN